RPGLPRGRRPDPRRSHRAILERGKEEFRWPLWRRRPGCFSAANGPLALSSPARYRSQQHDRCNLPGPVAGRLAAALQPERRFRQALGRLCDLHVLVDRGAGRGGTPPGGASHIRPDSWGVVTAGTSLGRLRSGGAPHVGQLSADLLTRGIDTRRLCSVAFVDGSAVRDGGQGQCCSLNGSNDRMWTVGRSRGGLVSQIDFGGPSLFKSVSWALYDQVGAHAHFPRERDAGDAATV